jgi:hypothetical protein
MGTGRRGSILLESLSVEMVPYEARDQGALLESAKVATGFEAFSPVFCAGT